MAQEIQCGSFRGQYTAGRAVDHRDRIALSQSAAIFQRHGNLDRRIDQAERRHSEIQPRDHAGLPSNQCATGF